MTLKDIEKKLKELDEFTLKLATENFELSQKVSNLDDQLEKIERQLVEIWKLLQKKK